MSVVPQPATSIRFALLHAAALLLGVCAWTGMARPARAERPAPELASGREEYLRSCARCHGVEGHGDGVDAKRFYPRPRDFTLGVYKFRSTASGTPPTDADLFRAITKGLPGSNMPDWGHLDEARRWQIVSYLKSLSPVFQEVAPESVQVADDPGPQRADLQKGRALYEQLGCAVCHGPHGRANGPSAAGLVDDWGASIRPANLTEGWNYRGWSDPESIMMRFLTGIDGAGMPSYAGVVSPEDAWHLAYYVASLQEAPRWHGIARAAFITGGLPSTPDDPRWDVAERTDVRLRNAVNAGGEWVSPPTVNRVTVQVLYDEQALALRLTWDDPSENRDGPPDALALLLKPATSVGDVVTLQTWPYAGAPKLDMCYWSAGAAGAYEAVTGDFSSVTSGGDRQSSLDAAARYDDGRWQLVLQRPLIRGEPQDAAAIRPEELTAVAFAAWDGGNAGERAVSPWIDIAFKPLRPGSSRH